MPKCTECEYMGKLDTRGSGEGLYRCERVAGGLIPKNIVEKDMNCLKYAAKGSVRGEETKK